jgi:hypothetical protein
VSGAVSTYNHFPSPYTQAVTPAKRAAQKRVVEMLVTKPEVVNGALSEPRIFGGIQDLRNRLVCSFFSSFD